MRNPQSSNVHWTQQRTVQARISSRIVAIIAALCCSPLLASEIDDNAKFNSSSTPQAEIPWVSGGIGEDARDEMRKSASAYNLFIVFSERQGGYLAGIPFAIMDSKGREVFAGISEGPLLFIKLPPAAYRVFAKIDGVWQKQKIQVGTMSRPVKTIFVSRGE